MKLTNNANIITLTTRIDNMEFDMVMNTSAFFMFTLTSDFHSHPFYELIGAVSGNFRVESYNGNTVEMTPGSLCLIPPGCPHSTNSDFPDHEMVVMRFSYKNVEGTHDMFSRFHKALSEIDRAVHFDDCSRLTELMLEIRDELTNGTLSARTVANTLMPALYIGILRIIDRPEQDLTVSVPGSDFEDNKQSRYFRIDRWLSEHHTLQVTADDLAEALNLSKRQLSRVLRDIYNLSFRELLVEYRLYRAIKLLTRTNYSIDRIAASVGYSSPAGFRRAFIKRFGITAGEYRKKNAFGKSKHNLY